MRGFRCKAAEAEQTGALGRSSVFEREPERIANSFVQVHPDPVRVGQEDFHNARIKLSAGIPFDFLARRGNRQGLAIGTIGNHGIESVRDGENPGPDRNLLAAQSAWITRAVKTLLMR